LADTENFHFNPTRSDNGFCQQLTTNNMPFLTVFHIAKKGEGSFQLTDITFTQRKLEKVAIAGETGAGKSTLMKIIAGLTQPDSGDVLFDGEKVRGPADQLVPGHPGIAYLSQHFELQKFLRVEQVLEYSNTLSPKESDKLFEICQITHLLKRRTDQLSGGEKQRIAICRLLISSPRLLLLDEPYAHLDMDHKNALKTLIHDIGKKLKITCMIVSHDPMDTLSWADEMLVMKDGQLVQKGKPEVIYREPVDGYTGGLFGKYNLIRPAMFRKFSAIPAFRRVIARAGRKNIFVRPEQLKLTRENPRSIKGKIVQISFFGGYRELKVSISANDSLIVKSDATGVDIGDTVFLTSRSGSPPWLV
jgi:iron(III) transport system ATP-binding protein